MTKIGGKRIRTVRCRGGNKKFRALRLDTGNFSWGSEVCTRKTRILDVVYNASNNELVRTKTLVKNAIVQIDATPFRQWYEAHYGVVVGKKRKKETEDKPDEEKNRASQCRRKLLVARTAACLIRISTASSTLVACLLAFRLAQVSVGDAMATSLRVKNLNST